MLEFWFNTQVPTFKKLVILIITLLICIALYQYQPLPLDTILMFTGTGVIFLICRYFKLHFAQSNPTGLLYRLFTWIPIALLFALIFVKAMPNLLIWGVQGIAFMALAAFIFSPQSIFNK